MGQFEVKVGDDLITPIIEAKVQAAIVESLGQERGLIERVVAEALTRKVEAEKYSSKRVPWIELVCHKVIREAAEQAIQTWAASHKEAIAEEFVRQLSTKKVSSQVVKAMIAGMAGVAGSKWHFQVELPQ